MDAMSYRKFHQYITAVELGYFDGTTVLCIDIRTVQERSRESVEPNLRYNFVSFL